MYVCVCRLTDVLFYFCDVYILIECLCIGGVYVYMYAFMYVCSYLRVTLGKGMGMMFERERERERERVKSCVLRAGNLFSGYYLCTLLHLVKKVIFFVTIYIQ